MPLKKLLVSMYLWCIDSPQDVIMHQLEMAPNSRKTVIDWVNFMHDVCQEHLLHNPPEIGGVDELGNMRTVEIDESLFFHRKYEKRCSARSLGGVERETGDCFMVEVPDRTCTTLEPLIQQYILPGSHIVSDRWPAYANIAGGIYTHDVVVHERFFMNPEDEVHTQNIENTWMRAKRKMKPQFGTSRHLFSTYLCEFTWRNKFRHNWSSLSGQFLVCVVNDIMYNF